MLAGGRAMKRILQVAIVCALASVPAIGFAQDESLPMIDYYQLAAPGTYAGEQSAPQQRGRIAQ
jgi:hypothetical protein